MKFLNVAFLSRHQIAVHALFANAVSAAAPPRHGTLNRNTSLACRTGARKAVWRTTPAGGLECRWVADEGAQGRPWRRTAYARIGACVPGTGRRA